MGLALGTNLKFYISVAKGLKLSQKAFAANSYVCRCYTGKSNRGRPFCPPPHSWVGLRLLLSNYRMYLYCFLITRVSVILDTIKRHGAEIVEILLNINNQNKIYEFKKQYPEAEVLHVEVSGYSRVEDQISTPIVTIFPSSVIVS